MLLIPNNIPLFLGVFIGTSILANVYRLHRTAGLPEGYAETKATKPDSKISEAIANCRQLYPFLTPKEKFLTVAGIVGIGIFIGASAAVGLSFELLLTAGIYNAFANPSAPTAVLGICCAAVKMHEVVSGVNSATKKNSRVID